MACALSIMSDSRFSIFIVQKTWHRLKTVGLLHDAIPNPSDRVGHPMHVKVRSPLFILF